MKAANRESLMLNRIEISLPQHLMSLMLSAFFEQTDNNFTNKCLNRGSRMFIVARWISVISDYASKPKQRRELHFHFCSIIYTDCFDSSLCVSRPTTSSSKTKSWKGVEVWCVGQTWGHGVRRTEQRFPVVMSDCESHRVRSCCWIRTDITDSKARLWSLFTSSSFCLLAHWYQRTTNWISYQNICGKRLTGFWGEFAVHLTSLFRCIVMSQVLTLSVDSLRKDVPLDGNWTKNVTHRLQMVRRWIVKHRPTTANTIWRQRFSIVWLLSISCEKS